MVEPYTSEAVLSIKNTRKYLPFSEPCLPPNTTKLTVLQYNILAESLVRHVDYQDTPKRLIDWSYREKQLI